MSDSVLSIDVSVTPARAVVASMQDGRLRLVESHEIDIPPDAFTYLRRVEAPPEGVSGLEETQIPLTDNLPPTSQQQAIEAIRNAVDQFNTKWHDVVLVIPGFDSLSLNLELPFNDPRKIKKIINLEVQDLVPFDVEDFLVDYRVVSDQSDSKFDVHITLLPKTTMTGALDTCRKAGIDPFLVTTPAAALAAIFDLAPNYFVKNCVVIWANEPNCAVSFVLNGKMLATRILTPLSNEIQWAPGTILQQLKVTIAAFERRYSSTVEKVYLFGSSLRSEEIQNSTGRDVEKVAISEIVSGDMTVESLAGMAAYFAIDSRPPVFNNFRVGEFAYRPQFTELIAGLRTTIPYLAIFIALVIISFGGIYYLRADKTSKMRQIMADQIAREIPDAKLQPGEETGFVVSRINSLEGQLKELGSLSKLSPLDALLEVSKDIPVTPDLSIFNISIRESRVTVKGTVNSYPTIDKIVKALKDKNSTYCNVDLKPVPSYGATKDFDLILQLC